MATLYVSDLDGTLLSPEAVVTPRSAGLLNEAVRAGAMFTVATARTPATVVPLMAGVDMRLPAVVLTGAALWHFDTQRYSDMQLLDPRDVETITDVFAAARISPFVYTIDEVDDAHILRVYYRDPDPCPVDRKFIDQRRMSPLKRFCIGADVPPARRDKALLFYASGSRQAVREVANTIGRVTDCSVSCYDDIYNPDTGLIEVFAPGVSKAAAIQRLVARTGASDITVFGDNLNDLAMFAIADNAIAVDNALPAVKAAAHRVIGPNTADAVARYILASTS